VLVESYSVLTRLPPPHRAPAAVVAEFLGKRFPAPPLTLPPREHSRFIQEMAEIEVVGGSVYDALIAAQARKAGATLVSRDVQAAVVYEAVGVRFELIA
jgi:predicted nucleic acid-binding protein